HSGGSGGRGHGRARAAAEPPAGRGEGRSRVLPRALMGVAALVVFVGVVVGAWHVGSSMSGSGTEGTETGGSQQASGEDPAEEAGLAALSPSGADVYVESGGGDHAHKAALAIARDPSTAWKTSTYRGPQLGGLTSGIGLLLGSCGGLEAA